MTAHFRNTCLSVGDELGAHILAAWKRDHPGEDGPNTVHEVPWDAEVRIAPADGPIYDLDMGEAVRIVLADVPLEYRAAVDAGEDGEAVLYYSVRMAKSRRRKRT